LQPHPPHKAFAHHGGGQVEEHDHGVDRSAACSRHGLPLSIAREQPSGNARPSISPAKKNHRCSRLLLAHAQMLAVSDSIVPARILDRQDAPKRGSRQTNAPTTSPGRLASNGDLGVSNHLRQTRQASN
jgi:hypothetical protein